MTDLPLKFERDVRLELVRQFQQYLDDEFSLDAGDLATEFLVDFAGKVLGPLYYNRGLRDALQAANAHAEGLTVDVLALVKDEPAERSRD